MREINQIFYGVEDPRRSNATRRDLCEMPAIGLPRAARGGEGCVDMARSDARSRSFRGDS